MFSFTMKSVRRRGRRGRLLASVLGLLAAFFFMGCPMSSGGGVDGPNANNNPPAPVSLAGTWSSTGGDGYTIAGIKLTYKGVDSSEYGKFSFTGTILNAPDFTATSGVIIVMYDLLNKPKPNTAAGMAAPTGDYQGIYWKTLSANSVSMAGAYKAGDTEKKTLEEAKKEFTLDKTSNYVTYWGAYTR